MTSKYTVYRESQLNELTQSTDKRFQEDSPFDLLENVGDWVFIPDEDRSEASLEHDSRPAAPSRLLHQGRKYSTRKRIMDGGTGLVLLRVR